ncbi:MAG TPA: transglycosylase domain-containing protein, partial [Candidatus Saccharimonadaceae bacterium]|nr:transglycosylase domain-containing protein [Candidatus Saccharimonadaceae bacterium]
MAKRPTKARNLSVYSNLTKKRRSKKDANARKKAEYLATLPKNPLKRALYRMHPKRVYQYWFSKKGGIMALKVLGVVILLGFLMIGALFAYYRKDLDSINPDQLANRVQTTVTTYYDRNGKVLWQDKGTGNYKLVVKGSDIPNNMKNATIAIEDKDYWHHGAISITGIVRAALSNVTGHDAQGGSTLTQQLVKQVFFANDHSDRGLG